VWPNVAVDPLIGNVTEVAGAELLSLLPSFTADGEEIGSILMGVQRCCSTWKIAADLSGEVMTPSVNFPWASRAT
jgi:hypothetical protein